MTDGAQNLPLITPTLSGSRAWLADIAPFASNAAFAGFLVGRASRHTVRALALIVLHINQSSRLVERVVSAYARRQIAV